MQPREQVDAVRGRVRDEQQAHDPGQRIAVGLR